jgi:hypothetical protein
MSSAKIIEFPMKEIKARIAKLKRREKRLAKKEADDKAWAERYDSAMKKSKQNIEDLTDDEFMALLGLGVDESRHEV